MRNWKPSFRDRTNGWNTEKEVEMRSFASSSSAPLPSSSISTASVATPSSTSAQICLPSWLTRKAGDGGGGNVKAISKIDPLVTAPSSPPSYPPPPVPSCNPTAIRLPPSNVEAVSQIRRQPSEIHQLVRVPSSPPSYSPPPVPNPRPTPNPWIRLLQSLIAGDSGEDDQVVANIDDQPVRVPPLSFLFPRSRPQS